jgi:hypothetical protein
VAASDVALSLATATAQATSKIKSPELITAPF